ncbi:hypothetical protein GCM10027569_86510 [Flindersiella endophytica]
MHAFALPQDVREALACVYLLCRRTWLTSVNPTTGPNCRGHLSQWLEVKVQAALDPVRLMSQALRGLPTAVTAGSPLHLRDVYSLGSGSPEPQRVDMVVSR